MLDGTLTELHTHAALASFACGCFALVEDYAKRGRFFHRRFDTHPVSGCDHSACRYRHRCGASTDGRHAGECGPRPFDRPDAPAVAPAPENPPALTIPAPEPTPEPMPAWRAQALRMTDPVVRRRVPVPAGSVDDEAPF
jgi:hypothetical protein